LRQIKDLHKLNSFLDFDLARVIECRRTNANLELPSDLQPIRTQDGSEFCQPAASETRNMTMNQRNPVHSLKHAAGQRSMEAQFDSANSRLASDGIETEKSEAQHYLRLASSQGTVKANIPSGIVLCPVGLHDVPVHSCFASEFFKTLSDPFDRIEVVEAHEDLAAIFTLLRKDRLPDFSLESERFSRVRCLNCLMCDGQRHPWRSGRIQRLLDGSRFAPGPTV
jgi:hypothetical protein